MYQILTIVSFTIAVLIFSVYLIVCVKNKELQDDLKYKSEYTAKLEYRNRFLEHLVEAKIDAQLSKVDFENHEKIKSWLILNDNSYINSTTINNDGEVIKLKDIK